MKVNESVNEVGGLVCSCWWIAMCVSVSVCVHNRTRRSRYQQHQHTPCAPVAPWRFSNVRPCTVPWWNRRCRVNVLHLVPRCTCVYWEATMVSGACAVYRAPVLYGSSPRAVAYCTWPLSLPIANIKTQGLRGCVDKDDKGAYRPVRYS